MNEIETVTEQVETFQIGLTSRGQKTTEERLKELERTNFWNLVFHFVVTLALAVVTIFIVLLVARVEEIARWFEILGINI